MASGLSETQRLHPSLLYSVSHFGRSPGAFIAVPPLLGPEHEILVQTEHNLLSELT